MNKVTLLAMVFIALGPMASADESSRSGEPNMSCGDVYSASWDSCVGVAAYPNRNI